MIHITTLLLATNAVDCKCTDLMLTKGEIVLQKATEAASALNDYIDMPRDFESCVDLTAHAKGIVANTTGSKTCDTSNRYRFNQQLLGTWRSS